MIVTVEEAVRILKAGGIAAIPTETVYGLAADACNEQAVLRVFKAKNRPPSNPLICHLPDAESISRYALSPPAWAAQFWPGPLTVLLEHNGSLAPSVTAGSRFCAFRIPDHPVTQRLLSLVNTPLCAPSANTSGRVSPVNAEMVERDLGSRIDGIVDGGPCRVGIESTIVQPLGAREAFILRPGSISREDLLGAGVLVREGSAEKSPGQEAAHYAPAVPLLLLSLSPETDAAALAFTPERTLVLSFGPGPSPQLSAECKQWNLSPGGSLEEAARGLFAAFDRASRMDIDLIVAADPPKNGMGAALHDRLLRASAFLGYCRHGQLYALPREGNGV